MKLGYAPILLMIFPLLAGDGDAFSLDTYSDGGHAPFMAETSQASGQYWKLTRLTRQ